MRGQVVNDTGAPIMIPVGPETLGRIINVIGDPIDERGPVPTDKRQVKMKKIKKIREMCEAEGGRYCCLIEPSVPLHTVWRILHASFRTFFMLSLRI